MLYKSLVKKVSIPSEKKIKKKDYLESGILPIIDQGSEFIGGYSYDINKAIQCNLPVIVFGDHTKTVKYLNTRFGAGADGIKILEPKDSVFSKYLYYGTQYLTLKIVDKGYARHYQHIEKEDLPLPSFEEQERIVSRIEELFSQLDSGVGTLKKTKEQLAVYRQAVLNDVLGKGTAMTIRDCIEDMGQGWSPKCIRSPVLNDTEWAVITTTAVQPMKFFFNENKKLPDSLEPRTKHLIEIGDILITRAGPRVRCGVCCMVKHTKARLINCDKVYRLRVKKSVLLPEYTEIVLNAPVFQKKISFCKTGGNDSGVNLTQERFLSITIPVPELKMQKKMIEEIESRLSVCDSIEKTIDIALHEAEALRQSILKQAFEGGMK